jgi:hypothetical protein
MFKKLLWIITFTCVMTIVVSSCDNALIRLL